jgi:hypothetical protein
LRVSAQSAQQAAMKLPRGALLSEVTDFSGSAPL